MALEWSWMNYPIGFPLDDDEDLGGERTGPKCSLTMTYTDEDMSVKQAVMMNGNRTDISYVKKYKAKVLMLEWLADQFKQRIKDADVDDATK